MKKDAKQIIFSTKNKDKILKEYNKLSISEKQLFLKDPKVKDRTAKIADINLLVSLLIDHPFEFRIDFLNELFTKKFKEDYEQIVISILQLANFESLDVQNLIYLEKAKDKSFIPLILRKLSAEKLLQIINLNFPQVIKDYAFIEYSKKCSNLDLDENLLNSISVGTLKLALSQRKKNNKQTNIDMKLFLESDLIRSNMDLQNIVAEFIQVNEYISLCQEKYATIEPQEARNCFINLLNNMNYMNLLEMQTIISYVNEKDAIELLRLFFKDGLKFDAQVEEKYLRIMLFKFQSQRGTTNEILRLKKLSPFALIQYLNGESVIENIDHVLNKYITVEQYQKTSNKKIRKISNLILQLNDSAEQSQKEILDLSYKLYYVFGYTISIELLSGKFEPIDLKKIAMLVNMCDIKNVEFKKEGNNYEPILKHEFIQFLIGDKKDSNTTIRRILRGELDIVIKSLPALYNNLEKFQQIIGNKIHLNELLPLLQENPLLLSPKEYKLTNDLMNMILKSFHFNFDDRSTINNLELQQKEADIACKFYHDYLEKRVVSSIPRVMGKTDQAYSYEVLKLNDPYIMAVGYQTKCCFRLNGLSKEFLKYCSESPYARVIVIRNKANEISAMVPIIRNGNVIVGNSVEANSHGDENINYDTLVQAYKHLITISKKYETDPIIACCITNLHGNVFSAHKIQRHIYPIRDNDFYTNYNSDTYIAAKEDGITEEDFRLYTPDAIYYDERPEILVHTWKNRNELAVKRVKAILCELNIQNNPLEYTSELICSEDWFLNVTYSGINGYCLDKDPRARIEFENAKKYLEQRLANKSFYYLPEEDCTQNELFRSTERILNKKDI